ncbi:MAG TPA: ectoine/hydroxyectoine ABC transporter permease subunit EhuC [Trueperaceae bacterium]|nr:ectoine/hydroxyectoine ABC transporter permease subunit EhuC [Trueperaceae bacterium]
METLSSLLPPLLKGARLTAELALVSTGVGAVMAFLSGIGKLSRIWPARMLSIVYIEVFRGTSLLVQMFWLYYALPLLGVSLGATLAGILALGLNIGAYGAEVVRGAILAVPTGQYEAAVALNFSKRYTLWNVVLPQALVEMMPPFGNLAVQNLKDTALVSLITLSDLTFRAQNLRNLTLDTVPIYSLTLVLYFVMALILMALMRLLERVIANRVGVTAARARS